MTSQTKQVFFILFFISLSFLSCDSNNAPTQKGEQKETTMKKSEKKEKLLRHSVIFKFKNDASEADVNKINEAFIALPKAIPVIKDFEWGLNHSPENLDQDFTHCYLVTFESEEDRDSIYAPHPAHQAFVASLEPHIEKVFVVDYWTNP